MTVLFLPCISFSCLIVLAKTSNMLLNRNGENVCSCAVWGALSAPYSLSHVPVGEVLIELKIGGSGF